MQLEYINFPNIPAMTMLYGIKVLKCVDSPVRLSPYCYKGFCSEPSFGSSVVFDIKNNGT